MFGFKRRKSCGYDPCFGDGLMKLSRTFDVLDITISLYR
jgi:hypothetical protein